ncbi:MAG TPA: ATP-binding cassette domain-containing protein [Candidatus Acidoferrales bacterium]|nr:ATP-binding cassette domain-containing protein [Candidatus Acidoferrales bacterium]
MSKPVLQLEKLSKTYTLGKRTVPALSNLNLTVTAGEFVAIMGPSGSGKTTLLNVIGCIDKPTGGQILIDGVDVTDMPENELYKIRRDKMGFVFQTFNLLPYLNARENVELPMEGRIQSKSERRKKASELLAMVGLSGREEHRPQKLSAGEQQRVAIARALANSPAIILADEPTGNLDTQNKQGIIKLLANLNVTQGTTIIMVTHDGEAAHHTERMLLLRDGKIVKEKQGSHAMKKNHACPSCGAAIKLSDDICPSCHKPIYSKDEAF